MMAVSRAGTAMVRVGKWAVITALSALAFGCTRPSATTAQPGGAAAGSAHIAWLSDYRQAVGRARAENKPLMVEVSTVGCSACKRLEEEVLSRPDVVAASSAFVPVRVDGDRQPELKRQLEVSGYPTVVFLESGGKEIGRVRGAVPHQVMLKELGKAAARGGAAGPG